MSNIETQLKTLNDIHKLINESINENHAPENLLNLYIKNYLKISHLLGNINIIYFEFKPIEHSSNQQL